jgi:hypothetical protein
LCFPDIIRPCIPIGDRELVRRDAEQGSPLTSKGGRLWDEKTAPQNKNNRRKITGTAQKTAAERALT